MLTLGQAMNTLQVECPRLILILSVRCWIAIDDVEHIQNILNDRAGVNAALGASIGFSKILHDIL